MSEFKNRLVAILNEKVDRGRVMNGWSAANSNKIRQLRKTALVEGISFSDFTDTMTIGTWDAQLQRTAETKEESLEYFGIVLFGNADKVSEMTRKFSLWK